MSGHVLSSDEIDALLQAGSKESPYRSSADLFASVTQNLIKPISELAAKNVQIEGPYIESIEGTLEQVITEKVLLFPLEIGGSELFLFISQADSLILGKKLNLSEKEAFNRLGRIWAEQLARALSGLKGKTVSLKYFQVLGLDLPPLAQLSVESNSLLIRHLLHWEETGLEICLFLQGSQIPILMARAKQKLRTGLSPRDKPRSEGGLLKAASPVAEAAFQPLNPEFPDPNDHPIALVEDISLPVIVELGRVGLTLNDLLGLKPQTVISLERHAGESVDVFINDNPVAKGEVVVLDEHFGVRILEIAPKSERIITD
ncbi:MAG: hypothetical protein GX335_00350 [Firmicutes bacterium]|nr:hypothetical protein [Bacillota bacterium]